VRPKNQFSLTRAALSTCGRAKSKFLSVTRLRYISRGLLARLWNDVAGDAKVIDPTGLLDGFYYCFVDAMILATNYSVTAESSSKFDASLNGSIDIPAIPGGKANITFNRQSDLKITASVQSDQPFLVALSTCDWSNCDQS
jgi:hypothetical protein